MIPKGTSLIIIKESREKGSFGNILEYDPVFDLYWVMLERSVSPFYGWYSVDEFKEAK